METILKGNSLKFNFLDDPLQKGFRGTLLFEVNFIGWDNPCQKGLKGWLGVPVKFTFWAYPRQKAFWGRFPSEVERLCVHLRALPPSQVLQRHIGFRGEFHGSRLPLSEVFQRPIRRYREIHHSRRPPSEGLLGQVVSRGGTTLCPPQILTPVTGHSGAHCVLW